MPVGRQADKLDFTRGYMICLEGVDSLLWAGVCLQKNTESKGLAEKEQFAAMCLQPLFGLIDIRCERAGQRPKCRAVVGMAQVGEFVQADVVGDIFRGADEPPVEADAGGVAAYAPEGFGVGQGNGTRGQAGALDMAFEARQQIFVRTFEQEAAQMGQLGGGFFFGQQDFRRPDLDVVCRVDGQGRLNALIPNPFWKRVGGCLPGWCFV